jgi:integrase
MAALRDDQGEVLHSRSIPISEVKAAYARMIAERDSPVKRSDSATVLEVCDAYLAKVHADDATKTYKDRADTLFDLCYGLPPRFRDSSLIPGASDYVHKGYADLPASDLIPLYIDQWLAAHKTWKGGKRTRVQAVKRALNYGVESGLLSYSSLTGYKIQRQNARVTYLTPEQEAALIDAANPALAHAIKTCIRTGARPGCEFAALTAQHVKDHGDKMEWIFQPNESKTKRLRIIRITDAEIMDTTRKQMARYAKGFIFRNSQGGVWKRQNLALAFRKCKERLIKRDVEFDADACMYSCRHTFAKRILQGYWTGKATNIETLARLMGNSPQVCRDHYLQWTNTYEQPLWDAV